MTIPQNFDKLNNKRFNISKHQFRIENDNTTLGNYWIFHITGKHWPLHFEVDWKTGKYSIKKCEPGMGLTGRYITQNQPLMKELINDLTTFVDTFNRDIVSTLLNNKII
jgi:hypothetical protein